MVMKKLLLSILLSALSVAHVVQAEPLILEVDLEGALGVATAEYIIGGIEQAEARQAAALIIRMDTPGGLDAPMRDIIQSILASDVPVVTYVFPGGARADSAGTYILLASHVAAMAPTTHLGAATPVSMMGGGDFSPGGPAEPLENIGGEEEEPDNAKADNETAPESTAMERKVLNDAISYIRGLAEAHGRNAEWAEEAVRNAATLTATDALANNVIDIIVEDRDALIMALDGREVSLNNQAFVMVTEGAMIEKIEPNWRQKILNTIASPEIAILLLMIGLYGLLFEGYNPGAILPGVAGVICLLIAAYALQVLPVNYAGLALILVGMILIVAEAFVPSFGALGLGGLIAITFGSIMMFDTGVPGFGISITFVIAMALLAGGFLYWLASFLVKLRRRGPVSGRESITGRIGTALESFDSEGHIWLDGESWAAGSRVSIEKNQQVRVISVDGLVLQIEPLTESHPAGSELTT
ncbi:MAG: serine protease [Woeseia sp.]|nr:serine protease [Woeseia sp.]|tara:strand:+ start:162 stop:1574 length:1413 start_codon:yes stop_codon:yes gene_type:complete